MICQACTKVFQGNFYPRFQSRAHHQTVDDLWDAARRGCWICDKLFKELFDVYLSQCDAVDGISAEDKLAIMVEEIRAAKEPIVSDDSPDSFVTYSLNLDVTTTSYKCCELHLRTRSIFLKTGRTKSPDPESAHQFFSIASIDKSDSMHSSYLSHPEETQQLPLNLAKAWLEDCLKNHQNCLSLEPKWFPTRLLELNAPHSGMARLISSFDITPEAKYMTLSHCWGQAKFLKLTAQTHPMLLAGIQVSSLPKTFQDATKVALFLGSKFLWIDSLCIFQDSLEDWIYESSAMGNIYRNGACNLAATGSSDSNGGLFFEKSPSSLSLATPCFVTSSWTDAANSFWNVYPTYHGKNNFLNGPLLNRGWVVQERLMAARVLHFGPEQLYWECHQHDACETYPSGLPPIQDNRPELIAFKGKHQPLHLPNNATKMVEFWAAIVTTYSECSLTMENDKLVALSGVAKTLQKSSLNCQYLAGLWTYKLEYGLLWAVFSGGKSSVRPRNYRAPSWSWASVDAQIKFLWHSADQGISVIKILEVKTEALGIDPTGQVTSGYLKLRGPLVTISIQEYQKDDPPYKIKQDRKRGERFYIYPDIDDLCRNLHFMPIQAQTNNDGKFKGSYTGLLLKSTSNGKVGEFTRWGAAEVFFNSSITNLADIENEEWFEFPERTVDGKYTVTIT